MGKEPNPPNESSTPAWCLVTVAASIVLGLALMVDQASKLSATYDEVTYLQVGARWWRTCQQDSISRMGSPLTFWKVQQAPTLWALDRLGLGAWIDDPIGRQEDLIPVVRIGGLWIWVVALLIAACWARRLYGPRSMAMTAALFALSPNVLAHGTLSTMELPILASSSAMLLTFWSFLKSGNRRDFYVSAALGGLAMSCKFTTVLIPPILALVWAIALWTRPVEDRQNWSRRAFEVGKTVGGEMLVFVAVLVIANLAITGFATIPLSTRSGPHPLLEGRLNPTLERLTSKLFETSFPQDWVGFATQVVHQMGGGPSYLFGNRGLTGWRHYYPVALAVKVPIALWLLVAARLLMKGKARREDLQWVLPAIIAAFLLAAIVGSRRNYGVRYLLPLATPAVVWISALAEARMRAKGVAVIGLAGMALAVASIHPYELSYFNQVGGGPIGGRKILSDSNLDWGQGAKALAKLQRDRPEFRDLTLFYFSKTDPGHYGVEGARIVFDAESTPPVIPPKLEVETSYIGVSASLQWGPWGPDGYFALLDGVEPVLYTDDWTIAIYRASDLRRAEARALAGGLRTGRGPE